MLDVSPLVLLSHQLTCLVLCLGLSGIAVGLGARLPEPPRAVALADRRRLRRNAEPGHQHAVHPGGRAADRPAHPLLPGRPVSPAWRRHRRQPSERAMVGGTLVGQPASPAASCSGPSPPSFPCGSASASFRQMEFVARFSPLHSRKRDRRSRLYEPARTSARDDKHEAATAQQKKCNQQSRQTQQSMQMARMSRYS